jgi:peptidoglycan/LPS O-acetylase OafA/YrhL
MNNSGLKIYFPNLHGLRAIAALLVLLCHIELVKEWNGYESSLDPLFRVSISITSVVWFFVLSGFLITYLLMQEKENTGTVDIRNFYFKRTLRIWPLYFLIILLTLVISYQFNLFPNVKREDLENLNGAQFFLFVLIPYFAGILFTSSVYLNMGHLWSIGVEEQFYFIWPVLMRYTKNLVMLLMLIIFLFIISLLALSLLDNFSEIHFNPETWKVLNQIKACLSLARLSCMAIGGLGAYLLFYKKDFLRFIYRKDVQWAAYFLILSVCYVYPKIKVIRDEVYACLFCIVILNLAGNPESILKMDNKLMNYLGRISYGIYMYHFIMINLALMILKQFRMDQSSGIFFNLALYALSLFMTVVTAAVSYRYFEKVFLNLKEKELSVKTSLPG